MKAPNHPPTAYEVNRAIGMRREKVPWVKIGRRLGVSVKNLQKGVRQFRTVLIVRKSVDTPIDWW